MYISRSMQAFSPASGCCFDGTATGGGSVRALLRRVVGGMKAFGGAFVACGLSLQLRGAGVMRGSGLSA